MSRFDDHAHPMRIELRLQGFGDLYSQSFLDLKSAREDIHDARNFAQSHHFLVGQIADVNFSVERQQMMLAHAEEIDVLYDNHLIVFNWEKRTVQEVIDVAVIALGHEAEGLGHSLGSLDEPVPSGCFAKCQQHLCDQGLYRIQIRRTAIPADIVDLLLAPKPDSLLSHAAPL